MIAKVEPLTTARALRGPFDYRIPRDMPDIGVGSMLEVPFGRRRLLGVVVGTSGESDLPDERLVEPLRALESGVPAELIELGLWVADAYCSTPARGLSLVLPPGTGTGKVAAVPRSRQRLAAELTVRGRAALDSEASERLTARQRELLTALTEGERTVVSLVRELGADYAQINRLAARDLVRLGMREQQRKVEEAERGAWLRKSPARPRAELVLTDAQRRALGPVIESLRARRCESFLLWGVTGSGKTEVYLRAATQTLAQGRSAIVMVPEIALTPQIAQRFEQRFGEQVAIMHSQLGLGERYDEWRRLRSGEARICVGPRSAVFAPLSDLGLIVVDEEHDSAYKQESDPRYDAREVARVRAHGGNAVLLAGSATPRPESWSSMRRLELPERIDGLALPNVELLDMRDCRHALHPESRRALERVRADGAKAIVLVGRRGWSPFIDCRHCGRTWLCQRCDVTLTMHRDERGQLLRCHHCGRAEPVPSRCPDCGSSAVARHGAGTQRLESELREALSPMPVFRLDADAAARKGGTAAVLERFVRASSGVLIGTQMVAQGHDFPEVELALVQDADATLHFPDFRAQERTFSGVAQLAGRSGRSVRGGRVLVQTLDPSASALRLAARHDSRGFLEEEIRRRRELGYPPFSTLAKVIVSASGQDAADAAARQLAARLEIESAQLLGPAPLFKLKDRCRSVLMLKFSPQQRIAVVDRLATAVATVARGRAASAVKLAVDVDPQ